MVFVSLPDKMEADLELGYLREMHDKNIRLFLTEECSYEMASSIQTISTGLIFTDQLPTTRIFKNV